jgi:hypothetical protein
VLDRMLRRLQALVRASEYVMTLHGHEEMEADGRTVYDVEEVILNGPDCGASTGSTPEGVEVPRGRCHARWRCGDGRREDRADGETDRRDRVRAVGTGAA